MTRTDSLYAILLDVRKARPLVADAKALDAWLAALTQLIQALPTPHARWAAVVLVANDLARAMPGIPLSLTYGWLVQRILTEESAAWRKEQG